MSGDFEARFSGVGRLVGRVGLARLRTAHVAVVGIGGVGSWAVEALARSGVGRLTLMDLDEVCVSNINRQLPALDSTLGCAKAAVMAERIRQIHPEAKVEAQLEFFTAATADNFLKSGFDFVVDAIDDVENKALLLALCRERRIPIITTGGAGGRRDPCRIESRDLAFTTHDPLLQEVRKRLRRDYGFPRENKAAFGIECVFSTEPVVYPHSDGTVCETREAGSELRLNCDTGYGTAAFVTGVFGFVAAGTVIQRLTADG